MTAFFSALIMFTQYLADFTDTFRMVRWLMGMLDVGGYAPIIAVVPLIAAAFVWFATLPRTLDLLSLGAEAAAARGVDVVRAERTALVSASLATGAAVSIGGPVGFTQNLELDDRVFPPALGDEVIPGFGGVRL